MATKEAKSNVVTAVIPATPPTFTFNILSGDNSTGPFGVGSGEGWADSDNATFPMITHSVGATVQSPPILYGVVRIAMACYIGGGPNSFNVFAKGTQPQALFSSIKFTDRNAVLETYLTAAATYDTTTYPGFTWWHWPGVLGFPFNNGVNYPMTITG